MKTRTARTERVLPGFRLSDALLTLRTPPYRPEADSRRWADHHAWLATLGTLAKRGQNGRAAAVADPTRLEKSPGA